MTFLSEESDYFFARMLSALCLLGIGALVAGPIYRRFGSRAGLSLAALPAFVFLWLLTLAPVVRDGQPVVLSLPWVTSLGFEFSLRLDGLSWLFGLLISGIGALVVLYAADYLAHDEEGSRFLSALFLFMTAMLGVVWADNVVALFVFWELTSFASYLLIGHHHEEEASRRAALQALLVTGLGGLFLLAGLLMLAHAAGDYNLSGILKSEGLTEHSFFAPALICILIGAFTKSAQAPFHFWLPNAMAAPTPASAYLHSSTMVKAGVYLLARLNPLAGGDEIWQTALPAVGAATLALGAAMAYRQTLLKRLLAYTTVAALGGMTMLIGIGGAAAAKAVSAFILAHALYKAALFLVAGIIDHETAERDVRRLGGLRAAMPLTTVGAALSALSMMGLPPFFGFVAKEALLAAEGAVWLAAVAVFSGALFVAVAFLTGIKPFAGRSPGFAHDPHEPPAGMWIGPVLLGALGLAFGPFAGWAGGWLVAPAAASIAGEAVKVKLALWHGLNRELALSGLTFACGVAAVALYRPLMPLMERLAVVAKAGPDRLYDLALRGLLALAGGQTRLLQNGSLRIYLSTLLSFVVLTSGWYFLQMVALPKIEGLSPVRLIDSVLLLLIVVSVAGAMFSRSRLAAFACLGVTGYSIAVFFVLYSAPDLAMTQLVIETLTVILLVLAFHHLPPFNPQTAGPVRLRELAPPVLIGVFMAAITFAANRAEHAERISHFFNENSWTSAYGKNIVNVILVDFRALDTLGEITVLALAGLGSVALLKLRLGGKGGSPSP